MVLVTVPSPMLQLQQQKVTFVLVGETATVRFRRHNYSTNAYLQGKLPRTFWLHKAFMIWSSVATPFSSSPSMVPRLESSLLGTPRLLPSCILSLSLRTLYENAQ